MNCHTQKRELLELPYTKERIARTAAHKRENCMNCRTQKRELHELPYTKERIA